MKFVLSLSVIVLAVIQAQAQVIRIREDIRLGPMSVVTLQDIKTPLAKIAVSNPGAASGLCSIEIRTQPRVKAEVLKELVGRVDLSDLVSGADVFANMNIIEGAIIIQLPSVHSYVDGLILKSDQGQPLGQAIRKVIGDYVMIAAVAGLCK